MTRSRFCTQQPQMLFATVTRRRGFVQPWVKNHCPRHTEHILLNVICNTDVLNKCLLAVCRVEVNFVAFGSSQLFQLLCFCAVELAVFQTESISLHFSVV